MTLIEFIAPIKGARNRDRILAVLYYEQSFQNGKSFTVEEIRQLFKSARVKGFAKINIADILNKCEHYVDGHKVKNDPRQWKLTNSGFKFVRDKLSLAPVEPELEHNVDTLNSIVNKLTDARIKDYIVEATKCLSVDAKRATVVFLWAGVIRVIQEDLIRKNIKGLNVALKKHDPKVRDVTSINDFAYIKDDITLQAAQDLNMFDKKMISILPVSFCPRQYFSSGNPLGITTIFSSLKKKS